MVSTARGQGSCIYRVWGIRCGASAAAWKHHKKGRLAREKRAAVLGSSGARQAARKMVRMSCCACLCVGKVRRRRAGKSRRDRHPERERLQRREHGAGQAGSWYRGRKHRAAAGRGLRVSDKEHGRQELSSPRLADTHESTGQGHRQGGAAIKGKPAGRSGRVGRQLEQKRRLGRDMGEKQAGGRGKPGVGSCWAGCWGENRLPRQLHAQHAAPPGARISRGKTRGQGCAVRGDCGRQGSKQGGKLCRQLNLSPPSQDGLRAGSARAAGAGGLMHVAASGWARLSWLSKLSAAAASRHAWAAPDRRPGRCFPTGRTAPCRAVE